MAIDQRVALRAPDPFASGSRRLLETASRQITVSTCGRTVLTECALAALCVAPRGGVTADASTTVAGPAIRSKTEIGRLECAPGGVAACMREEGSA